MTKPNRLGAHLFLLFVRWMFFLFPVICKQRVKTVLTASNQSPAHWSVYNTSLFCLPSHPPVCWDHIIQASFDARPHTGGIHFMILFWGFTGVCSVLMGRQTGGGRLTAHRQVGPSRFERGTSKKSPLCLKWILLRSVIDVMKMLVCCWHILYKVL